MLTATPQTRAEQEAQWLEVVGRTAVSSTGVGSLQRGAAKAEVGYETYPLVLKLNSVGGEGWDERGRLCGVCIYILFPTPLLVSRQVFSLALAVLEITQKTGLRSACLHLLRAGIKGVPHHV